MLYDQNLFLFAFFTTFLVIVSYLSYTPNHALKLVDSEVPLVSNEFEEETFGTRDGNYGFRTWNRSHIFAFIHIGKAGGTSVDRTMLPLVQSFSQRKTNMYVGKRHFDWSYIEKWFDIDEVDVFTMLRDPVDRAISHFYFHKQLPYAQTDPVFLNLTLSEFLSNSKTMMKHRTIWFDGQAGIAWLAGTHTSQWVKNDQPDSDKNLVVNKILNEKKEIQMFNISDVCSRAADRLDQIIWFGILGDLRRSEIMLSRTVRTIKQIRMSHARPTTIDGGNHFSSPSDKEKLAMLMPMDIWLFEYAELLFEARWWHMMNGKARFVKPERPPFPNVSCVSTRYLFGCTNDIFESFISPETPEGHLKTFEGYFRGILNTTD